VAKQRHEAGDDALFPECRKRMKNLLEFALEAHAGVKRRSQLKAVTADFSVTGALWQLKGQPGSLQQIRIEAELHRQKLTTHFVGQYKRTTFVPYSVTLKTGAGRSKRPTPKAGWCPHGKLHL
jgi:hypothetical protein